MKTSNKELCFLEGHVAYDERMDEQCVEICDILNCLPGITTTESCCGHGRNEFMIFFRVVDRWEGLSFLGRCLDRRYGGSPYLTVELNNTDVNYNYVVFILRSRGIVGHKAYHEVKLLCKNMREHINHVPYRKMFMKNLDGFKVRTKKSEVKLEKEEKMSLSKCSTEGVVKYSRAVRPDAQPFDEIRIKTVPRYKTSEISGDEWRISAVVEFVRKGRVCYTYCTSNIEYAVQLLPAKLIKAVEEGDAYYGGEGDFCDQEGCSEKAEVTYKIKQDVCTRCGCKKDPVQFPGQETLHIRRFCKKHAQRGDCGLDDTDSNYELLEYVHK